MKKTTYYAVVKIVFNQYDENAHPSHILDECEYKFTLPPDVGEVLETQITEYHHPSMLEDDYKED